MVEIRCSYAELVDLNRLNAHPKNPNKHTKDQIDLLARLIEFYGFRHPVIVSKRSGFIVAGHGRLDAAKKLGLTQVPVDYQDFADDTQEYGFLVADNAIAGWSELDFASINLQLPDLGPNFDLDLLGIKDFELEPADKFAPQCDEDEVPEKVEPKTKPGDLYILGSHRLLCGDSTNIQHVECLMNGLTAELCVTSPPYADQRLYNDKSLDLDIDHIASFITASSHVVMLYAVVLGLMRREGDIVPYWDTFIQTAKNNDLPFISWNVWDKGYAGSIGNATAMFTIDHEWIFIFGKKKQLNLTVPNKYAGDIGDNSWIRNQDGSLTKAKEYVIRSHRQMGTVVRCTGEKQSTLYKHPAMYPVELPEKHIEACTDRDDVVYEPFSGSGTTLIASEKTGRRCFGMEIDPHYCDVIVARWENFTGKKAVLNGQTNS